jgi:hypothetical protein
MPMDGNFNISTPALSFSAIGLFILAFTNRFHTVAALIRQFVSSYQEKPDNDKLQQIQTFRLRLTLIKYTQAFGVLSFLICSVSMICIMMHCQLISELLFIASLVSMVISLILAMLEIMKSITALNIELKKIGTGNPGNMQNARSL